MTKLITKLFPLLAMMVLFIAPFAVQAETTCTCFCATKSGAVQVSESKVILDKCESLCEKNGSEFLSCAKSAREFPGNNALCFSAADCAKVKGTLDSQQPPECSSGMKYCFPTSQKVNVKLNVKIGAMETVGDLGDYVSTAYSWMLGAAAVIAVIFIMIGGLEWVLSAGGASSVTKAKDHIKNGIIGLLLLISVSLILQTVNPELLKLQVPKPSLLRQVVLADSSCEKLVQEGYTIETEQSAKKECGTTAVIKKDASGKDVADGLTCQYTKCAKGACIGLGSNPQCVECLSVSEANPNSPAQPSEAVCAMLETKEYDGKYLKNATFCSLAQVDAAGSIYGLIWSGVKESVGFESSKEKVCYQSKLDCSGFTDCGSYEDSEKVKSFYYSSSGLQASYLKSNIGFLCSNDPCDVADKSSDIGSCYWDGGNCVNMK